MQVVTWPAATNSAESAPLLSNDATGTSAFQASTTCCDASTGACPSSRAHMLVDQQALIPNASHAGAFYFHDVIRLLLKQMRT